MLSYIRNRWHPLWRLRRLRWFRWLQSKCDFSVGFQVGRVRCHGMLLRDFSYISAWETVEADLHDLLRKHVREIRATHFIDVGANIGIASWIVASEAPDIEMHLFEPEPENARLIQRTIRRNRLTRAKLWECAVSDADGTGDFFRDRVSGTTGSLKHRGGGLHTSYGVDTKTSFTVPTQRLDNLLPNLPANARMLMKIDVEKTEERVLAGAVELLKRHRPTIIIESFDIRALAMTEQLGYAIAKIDDHGNYLLTPPSALVSDGEGDVTRSCPR